MKPRRPENIAPPHDALGRKELVRTAWRCEKPACLTLLLTDILRVGCIVAAAWAAGGIIGHACGTHGLRPEQLHRAYYFLAAALLGRAALSALSDRTAADMSARLRGVWMRRALSAADTHAGRTSGSLFQTLLMEGSGRIEQFYRRYFPATLQLAIVPVLLTAAVLMIDWPSGLVLAITGPLIPVFMILIGFMSRDHMQRQWDVLTAMERRFSDILRGYEELQLLGQDNAVAAGVPQAAAQFRRTTLKVLWVAFLSALVLEIFAMLGTAMVAVQAGIRLVEGWMSLPTAWTVLLLAPEFYLPFRQLGATHHSGMEGSQAASKLLEMEAPSSTDSMVVNSIVQNSDPAATGLSICNLHFSHSGGRELFHGLTLNLPRTGLLAVTGPSGCGKSTLARLVCGMLLPTHGDMTWDGSRRQGIGTDAWQKNFARLPQQPKFLAGSIRANLMLANPDASDAECLSALEQAALSDWVEALPDGLSTSLADAAANMSEGQRLRLALARCLLTKRPILVLDEPASALDPDSEEILACLFAKLSTRRLLLIISHRPRTLAAATHRLSHIEGIWQFASGGTP